MNFRSSNILKSVEGGIAVKDACRGRGISSAAYCKGKSKYGGMEASDVQRMRELEAENRKLRQMHAELSLENVMLKDVIEKKPEGRFKERSWRRMRYVRARYERGPVVGRSASAGATTHTKPGRVTTARECRTLSEPADKKPT